jgi:hypothetical protein
MQAGLETLVFTSAKVLASGFHIAEGQDLVD